MQEVAITKEIVVGPRRPLLVIAGPCVIENRTVCLDIARVLHDACAALSLPYVFKASFDKANRTSAASPRGPGLEEGLKVLGAVKDRVGVPVLTDIHLPEQAPEVAKVVDVVQIPAFLCRQTDLLQAAADTGLPVHLKKGQFLSPAEMRNVVEKVIARGNRRILLCERGTFFGYNELVVDMRSIILMQQLGFPVVFDATHSTQRPGGMGDKSGGDREMAPVLAAAAVATGADGIFLETHPQPEKALSDAGTMLKLDTVPELLARLKGIGAVGSGRV
jgi:2-dehydro-3-deoxyphosphooctonate aldolase (KDO 8-P synthase)